jgi:hypothetical protein
LSHQKQENENDLGLVLKGEIYQRFIDGISLYVKARLDTP